MNYYEQFYDDLEFWDPEDYLYNRRDPYFHRNHSYRDENCHRDDPYSRDDPYYREDPRYHREYEEKRYHGPQEQGCYPKDRRVPYNRGGGGHFGERGHRRGHESPRSHGRSGRGVRNEGNVSGRGVDRGQGNKVRGNHRGRMKTMNFVKEGASNTASSLNQTARQDMVGKKEGNKSEQIRFDYKSYQNQPSESEIEEEQALKAYSCHLGFGYGYGPRSDLIEGDQPQWLIGTEDDSQAEGQEAVECSEQIESDLSEKQEAKTNVKTAMVSPSVNFVKAKSEFHSIDVAFHEIEEEKPKPNSLSVNFGNKRVGLGFGVSATKATAPGLDISSEYYAGLKDGHNLQMDAKFSRLQEAVKARSLPNKNAIEILHMAVDKVKMVINDEITSSNRTPTGQPMFLCRLQIDGVLIAQGQAMAKKAAKHQAYHNALEVISNQALTVNEISQGVFELRKKDVEFKTPSEVEESTAKGMGQKQQTTSQASQAAYNKPKIVFHQPSNSLTNKALEFKPPMSQNQYPVGKSPEDLAIKLMNFVKEGTKSETREKSSNVDCKSSTEKPPWKRSLGQSQNRDFSRLKFQKKGRNLGNSLEDLSQFILIDNTPMGQTVNELSVLHSSANFNRVVLKLEYENIPGGVCCSLALSDIIVAIAQGADKDDAKRKVAKDSFEYLRECCYTIKIKQAVDSDSSELTKEQLLSDIQKAGSADGGGVIPDTNIGNMLLRKMGWVGGGCGKDGKGIAEPVKAEMIIGREGLGLKAEKGIAKNFHQKVTKMLQDYIKSDEQKDLHFSSELTKDERAIIHNIGQKLGLKTQSKGKDENRYLIVSRKRSAQQLLQHVKESGGSTSKYELIPPGDPDLDVLRREDISHGHCAQ